MSWVDARTGRPRLLASKCATCVYRPGNPMSLRPGRLQQIQRDNIAAGGALTCHNTLSYGSYPDVRPAICRGFYTAVGQASHVIRIFERLLAMNGASWTLVVDPSRTNGRDLVVSRTMVTMRTCTNILRGSSPDGAEDEDCGFVGDVEVEIFNEADEQHADCAWVCPNCTDEHVEQL